MTPVPAATVLLPEPGLTIGAYALFAGLSDDRLPAAYRALASLPELGLLEMPLADAVGDRRALGAMRNGLPALVGERWSVVVTCIPTVMDRLAVNLRYGLASIDDEGRAAAVADVRRALGVAVQSAQAGGRQRVTAIQVHSAPGGAVASAVALERSLVELLGTDAAGADLVIEHCDAARPGRVPEKGFLELADELAVLASLDHARAGCTINWGRSAIEGRSAQTPLEHVEAAAGRGLLKGLMFSGATPAAGPGGGPWSDSHIAPRGAGEPRDQSLLGPKEISASLAAAGECKYMGLKITAGHPSASLEERIGVARDAVSMVIQAAAALAVDSSNFTVAEITQGT